MAFKFSITPDTTSGNTIRKFHEVPVNDNKIGALAFGKFAYGDEIWGDGVTAYWLRVLEVDGVPVTQESWIASIHNSKKVATIKPLDVVPPPPVPETDFKVGTSIGVMGVNAVIIEGDESKPFNIILNGRVIWP